MNLFKKALLFILQGWPLIPLENKENQGPGLFLEVILNRQTATKFLYYRQTLNRKNRENKLVVPQSCHKLQYNVLWCSWHVSWSVSSPTFPASFSYGINTNVFTKWRNINNVQAVAKKAFFQPLHKSMSLKIKITNFLIKNSDLISTSVYFEYLFFKITD